MTEFRQPFLKSGRQRIKSIAEDVHSVRRSFTGAVDLDPEPGG